jgi:hypothetical protein
VTASVAEHVTSLVTFRSRYGRGRPYVYAARCTCGWVGPERRGLIGAEDSSAAHLLEAQS